MKSIKEEIKEVTIIKKSKFICKLIPIFEFDSIKEEINKIKDEYKGATHYCYAYILGQKKGFSDDKEVPKTAGFPLLNILEKQELNYILCIVVRYFGGVKLGASNLPRAYTTPLLEALNKSEIIELEKGINLEIKFSYENEKQINYLFKKATNIKSIYTNQVLYSIDIAKKYFDEIKNSLNEFNYEIKKEILVQKL